MSVTVTSDDSGKITRINGPKFKVEIIHSDMREWTANYSGQPYHAALGDPPYHLTSITERFGGKSSSPANGQSDGGFNARKSGGFMHEDWDGTNYVAFCPDTWSALGNILHPGALIFMFGHSRTAWRMQAAQDAAGLDLYPIQWGWTYATGMATPAKAARLGGEWAEGDYRYGADILTPALEPIIISQNPYPSGARRLDIIKETGSGCFNREPARNRIGRLPKNLYVQHDPECIPDQCAPNCPASILNGKAEYYNDFYWNLEVEEHIFVRPGLLYCAKPTKAEREFGLDDLPEQSQSRLNSGGLSNDPSWAPKPSKNFHPTLKPISLTQTLATAILPPEGAISAPRRIVLPFAGVGSEAIGAMLAGWDEITCLEITEKYIPILVNRLAAWANRIDRTGIVLPDSIVEDDEEGQLSLFGK